MVVEGVAFEKFPYMKLGRATFNLEKGSIRFVRLGSIRVKLKSTGQYQKFGQYLIS